MTDFALAIQKSTDEIRSKIPAGDKDVWFDLLNPLTRSCLLVEREHTRFFKKCVLITLLPAIVVAAIGAFYSLRNGVSREIELLVAIPVFLAYAIGFLAYGVTLLRARRLVLSYRPFFEVAIQLASRVDRMRLLKVLFSMVGFVLFLVVGATLIVERGYYLMAIIIYSLIAFFVPPVSMVIIAIARSSRQRG